MLPYAFSLRRALLGLGIAASSAVACSSGGGSYVSGALDGGPEAATSTESDDRDASKRKDARTPDRPDGTGGTDDPETGPTSEAGCTPRTSFECYQGNVHYFDSCGAPGALKQVCSTGCEGSSCVSCDTHATSDCYSGSVYWFDSCGTREDLKQTCTNGCTSGVCNPCDSHASSKCYAGDAYWYDSCGKREELKEECLGSCNAGVCAASTWRCTNSSSCFCLVTTDAISYPSLGCTVTGNCCFEYQSTGGPACYCGTHDATTCASYVSSYNGTTRSSCPP